MCKIKKNFQVPQQTTYRALTYSWNKSGTLKTNPKLQSKLPRQLYGLSDRQKSQEMCKVIYSYITGPVFLSDKASPAANKVIKSQIVAVWRRAPIMIYRRGPLELVSNLFFYLFDFAGIFFCLIPLHVAGVSSFV